MQLQAFFDSCRMFDVPYECEVCDETGEAFGRRVRRFLEENELVVFHTDDDVFFARPPDWLEEEAGIWIASEWSIISLRLGANTVFQHPTGAWQRWPHNWRWRWRYAQGDFGYPLSLNATVYRSEWLLPLLDFSFANPTQFEAGLDGRRDRLQVEWMTSPQHSCCVSLPHNVVSTDSNNPRGSNPHWQPGWLAEMFEQGWRIDLAAMDFSDVIGAHQEIPLRFHHPETGEKL